MATKVPIRVQARKSNVKTTAPNRRRHRLSYMSAIALLASIPLVRQGFLRGGDLVVVTAGYYSSVVGQPAIIELASSGTNKSSTHNAPQPSSKDVDDKAKNFNKTSVLHFPLPGDDGVEMQLELDGLTGSQSIQLIHDVNASMLHPNIVWIGSSSPRRVCNAEWIKQAVEYYNARQPAAVPIANNNNNNMTNQSYRFGWTIHILDWGDSPYRIPRCHKAVELVGEENVHYWKRSIVKGRDWINRTQTIQLGYVATQTGGVDVHPLHLPTRTDVVQAIKAAVANYTKRTHHLSAKELTDFVVTNDRPGDVIHHWPVSGRSVDRGSQKGSNCMLRTTTSLTLLDMMQPPYNLDVFCGMKGVAKDQGRGSVSSDYIQSILHYKIMVITQRDTFEGHLRLFEGLVSGAMVIHDRIMSLPAGLEENVNIVFFDNQQELREKVMYYLSHDDERLAIARRGRQLAMCRRTWHLMERIILGRPVTPCDE